MLKLSGNTAYHQQVCAGYGRSADVQRIYALGSWISSVSSTKPEVRKNAAVL